jgi:hypothetical protein
MFSDEAREEEERRLVGRVEASFFQVCTVKQRNKTKRGTAHRLEVGDVGAQDGFNGGMLAVDGHVQSSVAVNVLVQSIGTSTYT